MRGLSPDQSCDLSKYFQAQDKSSLYNQSPSYNNQTLLLETTQIQKNRNTQPRQSNILQSPQHENHHSRSLLEDLYDQLEVTVGRNQHAQEINRQGLSDIYTMCRHLIGTLKKLESKVERIEENDTKGKNSQKQSSPWVQNKKEIQSILTYSSLQSSKGSKGCRCESEKNNNNFMNNLLEYVQYKSKLQIYKEENQQLKKGIIQLQVSNEEMKKQIKKLQGENLKVKELLRQYQNFNKKPSPKNQPPLQTQFSQRRISHIRSNTFEHQPQPQSPRFKAGFKLHKEEGKENIKQMLECKIKEQEYKDYYKQSPMTPNPLLVKTNSNVQYTENKSSGDSELKRFEALSERVERVLDLDNQKTHSKSKKERGQPLFQRRNKLHEKNSRQKGKIYYPFQQLLQQDTYQIKQTSKPSFHLYQQTLSETSCMSSLNHTNYRSPERLRNNGVGLYKK